MKHFILSCSAFIGASTLVFGQTSQDSLRTQQLNEVVVSDSRFALKRENSGKTIVTITAKDLERQQGKSVAAIINSVSGISINGSRSVAGTILGVYARGGRGRQVLVLIDGVRVSDPSSSSSEYDLRLLNSAMIESIEISKGAASTLYGSGAATAVISITTKKASSKKAALQVQSTIGTNQTQSNQTYDVSQITNAIALSGSKSNFNYMLDFSSVNSNGLSAIVTDGNERDPFNNYNTSARFGYNSNDVFTASIKASHTKLSSFYDEGYGNVDAPYQFLSEQNRFDTQLKYKYEQGSIHVNAAYSKFNSENISLYPGVFEARNTVVDAYHKYQYNNTLYTVLGLNYSKDETDFAATKRFTMTDPYANVVYLSSFGVQVNAGLRLNNHSEYGDTFVYNFNPSYLLPTNNGYVKFLSSYATSYITPSLTQLFGNFGANEDLLPESNRTLEGGVAFKTPNLLVSGLFFSRDESHFVYFDNAAFAYENATEKVQAKGVELEAKWMLTETLQFQGNYTFTERKGDLAVRIPKHSVQALLQYTPSTSTSYGLEFQHTGDRNDTDFNTFDSVVLEAYSIVNFNVRHTIIPNKMVGFLTADNIFNSDYTEIVGFSTLGRNFSLGFQLTL